MVIVGEKARRRPTPSVDGACRCLGYYALAPLPLSDVRLSVR